MSWYYTLASEKRISHFSHPWRACVWAGVGIAGFIFIIILGAVGGFIGGAILAFIYTIVLGAIGGIEMDLETKL